MIRRSRFILAIILFSMPAITANVSVSYAAETPPVIYVSLPWLAGVSRFIVGTTVNITEASVWNVSGVLRIPKKLPQGARLIALDPSDAARFDMKRGREGLYLLYDNLPIEEHERGMVPFNPSVLPFLSQRLLKVICEIKPENYSFYQRRLAEFQSHVESAVEVGRSQIGEVSLLDLTGSVSPWIRAASKHTVRPPEELWNAWIGNTRTPDLELAVKEAESRNWRIVVDPWTPAQIKNRVSRSFNLVTITPPSGSYEFFEYLRGIYLEIWLSATQSPPAKK